MEILLIFNEQNFVTENKKNILAYSEILYFQIGIFEINKLLHKHVLKLPLY